MEIVTIKFVIVNKFVYLQLHNVPYLFFDGGLVNVEIKLKTFFAPKLLCLSPPHYFDS